MHHSEANYFTQGWLNNSSVETVSQLSTPFPTERVNKKCKSN